MGEEVTKFVYEGDKVILELDENNNEKGANVDTNSGFIHYSNTGAHIVPAYPNK